MCENGGICNDGVCDCPVGYTGTYCRERDTPVSMHVLSLIVTRFPGYHNDMPWDDFDGPDLFFRIYNRSRPIAQPLTLYVNADISQPYQFFIPLIEIPNITETHFIRLLDYDGRDTKEDLLGEIEFTPFKSIDEMPTTIILDDGGPVAFEMTVKYLYAPHEKM